MRRCIFFPNPATAETFLHYDLRHQEYIEQQQDIDPKKEFFSFFPKTKYLLANYDAGILRKM